MGSWWRTRIISKRPGEVERKRMKDSDDSVALADMLVDCWSRIGVEEKELVDISIDCKGGKSW